MQATLERDFAEFMQADGAKLFRVAYLLTGNRHRAEDLTQDALARTYAAWPRVSGAGAFAYTRKVLVNLHNDWWRGGAWREKPVDIPPSNVDSSDHAGEVVRRDWVVRSLRELTRRERAIVVLRYYADLPEAQVAEELNVSLGTVKSTASRALDKLRAGMITETEGLEGRAMTVEAVRGKVQRRKIAIGAAVAALVTLVTIGIAWPLQASQTPLPVSVPTPSPSPSSAGTPLPPTPAPSPPSGTLSRRASGRQRRSRPARERCLRHLRKRR